MDKLASVVAKSSPEKKKAPEQPNPRRDKRQKRRWKPYKELTYQERKHLADREAIKDHLKQEVRNNPKFLKNLDYSKKSMHFINKPDTPHNTTQYLTSNFSQGRNEKVSTVVSEFTPIYDDGDEDMPDDYLNHADDYCIPGGSMKDVILKVQDDLMVDLIENEKEAEINPNPNTDLNHNTDLNSSAHLNAHQKQEEESEIEQYKKIIEQQNKMICMLTNKLKTAESEVNEQNLENNEANINTEVKDHTNMDKDKDKNDIP